jgi:hypothetical protein
VIAGRARLATVSIFILLAISTTGLGQERDDAFAHQAATRDEAAIQLRSLGQRLVAAVLAHDLETILAADRPALRAEDRLALQDQTSDLYIAFSSTRAARRSRRRSTISLRERDGSMSMCS